MTTPRRFAVALLALAALSLVGGAAASGAVTDPDGDGDLVCPPGATNAAYCTEDESGPTVDIAPGDVRLDRDNFARFRLFCRAPEGNTCFGTLTLTYRRRTVRNRRVTYRTVTLGQTDFVIRARRRTSVFVFVNSANRGYFNDSRSRRINAVATVVARYADNRDRTSTRPVVLQANR
jgi:hypothetical protein